VVEGDAREFIPRMVARIEQSARTDIEARQGEER
jgi:hypothetical protein